MKNNCYSCRRYFTDCAEPKHDDRIPAQHKDGTFWCGEPKKGAGRRVMICTECREAMAEGYPEMRSK